MDGIKPLYAGRGMTMWDTREEAEASWRVPSVMDRIERSNTAFWRLEPIPRERDKCNTPDQ